MNQGPSGQPWNLRVVEAVAAAAIVILCAALVLPAVRRARLHEDVKRVAAQGQQLRALILDANAAAEISGTQSPIWPSNTTVSSTAYFKRFFKSNLYTNPFPAALLAAPGIPVFTGTDSAAFAASNNAWCITAPVPYQTNDFPFLFTRNLSAGKQQGLTLKDIRQLDAGEPPFGNRAGVVITFQGQARVLRPKDLRGGVQLEALFNPASLTNAVLSPWTAKEWKLRTGEP